MYSVSARFFRNIKKCFPSAPHETSLDPRVEYCIQEDTKIKNIQKQYIRLQLITGLYLYDLNHFANLQLISSTNLSHDTFLECAWMEYKYISRRGEFKLHNIQVALQHALANKIGKSRLVMNMSKFTAKSIMDECANVTTKARALSSKIVCIQNCIHNQIRMLIS
ncbi:hypothetical protein PPYR_15637 [Photinus pyralis]|uniref:Uncharacterized protein n=1 Tax=Photinus pyralis TaxID=7054 RepID=A0A5N3ZYA3_PHOPY|nr:hypothetical protein PPYR_15637 [Photinus pyralis]